LNRQGAETAKKSTHGKLFTVYCSLNFLNRGETERNENTFHVFRFTFHGC